MPDNPTIYFVPTDRPVYAAALADNGALAIFYGAGGLAIDLSPAALRLLAERAVAIADALDATTKTVDAALARICHEAGHA